MSLISRKLLTPDEVLKIENPFAIVMMAGKPPALTNIPDISKMHFNKLNGMGTRRIKNKKRRSKRRKTDKTYKGLEYMESRLYKRRRYEHRTYSG